MVYYCHCSCQWHLEWSVIITAIVIVIWNGYYCYCSCQKHLEWSIIVVNCSCQKHLEWCIIVVACSCHKHVEWSIIVITCSCQGLLEWSIIVTAFVSSIWNGVLLSLQLSSTIGMVYYYHQLQLSRTSCQWHLQWSIIVINCNCQGPFATDIWKVCYCHHLRFNCCCERHLEWTD